MGRGRDGIFSQNKQCAAGGAACKWEHLPEEPNLSILGDCGSRRGHSYEGLPSQRNMGSFRRAARQEAAEDYLRNQRESPEA